MPTIKSLQYRIKRHLLAKRCDCPLCGTTNRYFLPFGHPLRTNAMCPVCRSLERHRVMWYYLKQSPDIQTIFDTGRMLHFAPENQFYHDFASRMGERYQPVDYSPEYFKHLTTVPIRQADITQLPDADNSYQLIFCHHVLEHIPDDAAALRELYRVLAPSGYLLVSFPFSDGRERTYEDFSIKTDAGRLAAFGQKDHVRIYGADVEHRMAAAGFSVKRLYPTDLLSSNQMRRWYAQPKEPFWELRK